MDTHVYISLTAVAQATCTLAQRAYPSWLRAYHRVMWSASFGEAPKRSANANAPPLGNASQNFLGFGPTPTRRGHIHHHSPMPKIICSVLKHVFRQFSRQGGIRHEYLVKARSKNLPLSKHTSRKGGVVNTDIEFLKRTSPPLLNKNA